MRCLLLLAGLASFSVLAAQPAWVEQSNQYATKVLTKLASFDPERGSELGIEKYDTQVTQLGLGVEKKELSAIADMVKSLSVAKQKETDPKVSQDLDIMISFLKQKESSIKVHEQYQLPFYDVGQDVFTGLQTLLDKRNSKQRMQKAVARLNAYAGLNGQASRVKQAELRTEQALKQNPKLLKPYYRSVDLAISSSDGYIKGIKQLFISHHIDGWEKGLAAFQSQLSDYKQWLKTQIQPIARHTTKIPEPLYTDELRQVGVIMSPKELIHRSMFEYAEIREEMQLLANQVAKEKGFKNSDYRYVVKELYKDRVTGKAVLPFFHHLLAKIENIIRDHDLVTLPKRQANVREETAAEFANAPFAHMNPPRLINNTGQYGDFVLPIVAGDAKDASASKAFAWTLTAHEARPGHELQYSSMVENGVSLARAIFADNSANVEGWAVYCEALILPYMPLEGQLFSLKARLRRAARAFLDPMLNLGLISPADAKALLMKDVGLSDAAAGYEVQRFIFRMPGQATAYFYGYMSLRELRVNTELKLKDKFNLKAFNDFVLSQGLLPPPLMKKAVETHFIPKYQ
ncbi:DUF885 domain-containing protein [Gallaecimonas mangrovi]|uniref:DUF885 domain-containing protein n=1 Tax=Gallaecimonas mangrovi TaxID=2291597 RepID=UPI000E209080|nr:DUF885 domain-containing protein [Gallaecimonas mangrovi]